MIKNIFKKIIGLPIYFKIAIVLLLILIAWFAYKSLSSSNSSSPTYQTSQVQKGNIIASISATGSVSSGNSTSLTTKASGTVKTVYVKNGDTVVKGQKIAEITLDEDGVKQQTQAYVNYLEAGQNVKSAQAAKTAADVQMWKDRQAIFDAIDAIDYKNNNTINPSTKEEYTDSEKTIIDKSLDNARAAFDVSELKYKNADSVISEAKVLQAAAWRDYQQVSSVIYAPSAGVVSNLTLTPGVIVTSTTDDNGNLSSKSVGNIESPNTQLQAKVSLTETDVIKVKADQKVTFTLDAYPDMSFTGKVLAVDTSGSSNSGVTSYSVIIALDPIDVTVYPNMAISANIITDFKADVLSVPSTAITTSDSVSTVKVMKDNQVSTLTVETGITGNSQTEIISGLSEGDQVVTSTIKSSSNSKSTSSSTTSVFGTSIGGGQLRMAR